LIQSPWRAREKQPLRFCHALNPRRFGEPTLPFVHGNRYDLTMAVPFRKHLDHTQHFAGRFGAIYFVTICSLPRGFNQLCHSETASILFETSRRYHEQQRWYLHLLVLMPDHLHALAGISGQTNLSSLIRDYKRVTAKIARVKWQRNFFDHRLRHDESLAEKFAYIRQNPARAGLVGNENAWPYVFIGDR